MLSEEQVARIDLVNFDAEGDTGYVLEVNLDYPSSLHAEHDDLPLGCGETESGNGRDFTHSTPPH